MTELQWIYDEHDFDRQEKHTSECEHCETKISHKIWTVPFFLDNFCL
ncbi:MAG: hypothetical protein ACQKHC_03040 [Candidatus Phytoplasma pruni]|nr:MULTISPECIES: hypothetical protein [16SrIII (X-disease group)]